MSSSSRILSRRDLDFMLYEWLDVECLIGAPRYAGHSREVFDSVLDLFEEIAEEHFAPINRLLDENEPTFDGVEVSQPAEARSALEVFARSGLASSGMDAEIGGGQDIKVGVLICGQFFGICGLESKKQKWFLN